MAEPARSRAPAPPGDVSSAPLGGTRAEAFRRLQFGLIGVVGVVLMVGLATVVENRAKEVERASVPDAAATTEPTAPVEQQDPLAEAGVVPEMPPSPAPTSSLPAGGSAKNPAASDTPSEGQAQGAR
ncbi:hypothetical protein [Qipengyuania sp.]|uniref:hypothetical protein n=1 Tax=Qipengyuania sp. TaxID=2004515 RepID=UPI0035C8460C